MKTLSLKHRAAISRGQRNRKIMGPFPIVHREDFEAWPAYVKWATARHRAVRIVDRWPSEVAGTWPWADTTGRCRPLFPEELPATDEQSMEDAELKAAEDIIDREMAGFLDAVRYIRSR